MELTRKQEEAIAMAIEGYENWEPYLCISGYAGTGKSTTIAHIIAALNLDPEQDVAFVAYTGKAAKVLASKGNPNATTIHKLIYKAKLMPNGKYFFTLRRELEKPYKVIVVDEVSMVPKKMWEELLGFGAFIIACGDPGQLPPVSSDDANGVLDKPHIFLDEIMRQAQDSEIIRLTMDIREGKPLKPFKGNDINIVYQKDMVSGMLTWADQVLVGTNETRTNLNNQIRAMQGRGPEPEVGDKVISLHNQWETISSTEAPLTNGSIGYLEAIKKSTFWLPPYIDDGKPLQCLISSIKEDTDDGMFMQIPIDYASIKDGEPQLSPRQQYQLRKSKKYEGPIPMPFAYGYVITAHKSQGSEWPKVTVVEERFPFDREEHKRWLYTACTRASEKLVLVLKG
jgi:exodeoxyribonuclease-5